MKLKVRRERVQRKFFDWCAYAMVRTYTGLIFRSLGLIKNQGL